MSDTPLMIKIMLFTISINLAFGFMAMFFPGATDHSEIVGNLRNDGAINGAIEAYDTDMSESISASGNLEDAGDAVYRILDLSVVGMITKFFKGIRTFLYGFVTFLQNTLGSYILQMDNGTAIYNSIFFILYTLNSIAYLFGAVWLFTGRKTTDG